MLAKANKNKKEKTMTKQQLKEKLAELRSS